MSKVIKNFNKNFTIADNRVAQCNELDLNAKGLYLYIASLPDDWEFSIERIAKANNTTEGKVKSGIEQLEKAGLLKRHYHLNSNGKRGIRADYEIYDFDTRIENSINKFSTPKNLSIEKYWIYKNNNITKKESDKKINKQKDLFDCEKSKEDSFSEFWSLYPRKVSKKMAEKAYKNASKKYSPTIILDGLKKWLKKWQNDKTEMNFIPHASTWLNGERFNDDITTTGEAINPIIKTGYEIKEAFCGSVSDYLKRIKND